METEESKNSEASNKSPETGGFDLSKLLNHPQFGELIKHLLSGGGAVLVTHLMSIMPMNEKIKELTDKNSELEAEIAAIREKLHEVIDHLNEKSETEYEDRLNGNEEYFPLQTNKGNRHSHRRKNFNSKL